LIFVVSEIEKSTVNENKGVSIKNSWKADDDKRTFVMPMILRIFVINTQIKILIFLQFLETPITKVIGFFLHYLKHYNSFYANMFFGELFSL
jgi:hypothetical protein